MGSTAGIIMPAPSTAASVRDLIGYCIVGTPPRPAIATLAQALGTRGVIEFGPTVNSITVALDVRRVARDERPDVDWRIAGIDRFGGYIALDVDDLVGHAGGAVSDARRGEREGWRWLWTWLFAWLALALGGQAALIYVAGGSMSTLLALLCAAASTVCGFAIAFVWRRPRGRAPKAATR